jgi:hypothetical protein
MVSSCLLFDPFASTKLMLVCCCIGVYGTPRMSILNQHYLVQVMSILNLPYIISCNLMMQSKLISCISICLRMGSSSLIWLCNRVSAKSTVKKLAKWAVVVQQISKPYALSSHNSFKCFICVITFCLLITM